MDEMDEAIISDMIYSVCTAVSEVAGRSGMAFVSMVGKNLLYMVEEKKKLPSDSEDMMKSLSDFLNFFVELGYASSIRVYMENNFLRLEFEDIKFLESEKLLYRDRSAVLPLYVTFAARAFLEKYFGLSLVYSDYGIENDQKTSAALCIL